MVSSIPLIGGIPAGLFGANKIPKLARSTGQAMGEFRKGREQVEEELKDMQDGEKADSTLDDEDDDLDELETETDKETSA